MFITCPIVILLIIGSIALTYVMRFNLKQSSHGNSQGLERLGGRLYLLSTDFDNPDSNIIRIFKSFSKVCFKEIPKLRKKQESKHEYRQPFAGVL